VTCLVQGKGLTRSPAHRLLLQMSDKYILTITGNSHSSKARTGLGMSKSCCFLSYGNLEI
jgi:hypothetical protein